MDPHHKDIIAKDEREALDAGTRSLIAAKLAWYSLSRPFFHRRLRAELVKLLPRLKDDPVFRRMDMFLNGDGGMFKKYVYERCSAMRPIKDARVLVPGVGYGQNLLQLAAFRPKEILAFDLYEYPEEWPVVAGKVKAAFGVPVKFLKGDFDAVPPERRGSFDLIISDAVLEHVPDMPAFAAASREFLKPGGVFYASFGPLWYGPCGDHADWGAEKLFDHVLLPKEEYERQLRENPPEIADGDSCDTGFMIQEGLFSYLQAHRYLEELEKNGFEITDLRAKIYLPAVRLLEEQPELHARLDAAGVPAFDRFSGGLYIWAQKPLSSGT